MEELGFTTKKPMARKIESAGPIKNQAFFVVIIKKMGQSIKPIQ